jgi:hypothetical protein
MTNVTRSQDEAEAMMETTPAPTAGPAMPAWFDPARHKYSTAGIMDRETGLWLAGDGLPFTGPVRARRLAEQGLAADPLELVTADMIAVQADGIAAERKAAAAERRAGRAKIEGDH